MSSNFHHKLPPGVQLSHVIRHEIATVYFYDSIAIVEVNEGVNLSIFNGVSLLLRGVQYLGTKPWVYISNRVNSYSVVPTDYTYFHKIPSLKAMAIVTNEPGGKLRPHIESVFCKKPFEIFDELEEAYFWGVEMMEKELTT